MKIKQRKRSLQ